MKQKSSDYKQTAVLYYMKNDVSYTDVCNIFNCNIRSLQRWIETYAQALNTKTIERKTKENVSYKIRKKHLDFAFRTLSKNEQITCQRLRCNTAASRSGIER